ncbi:hypothetical protein CEXT_671811 [Caerostris extrusa]|uniref:Uncharacterized protein n=1 Tax=Caerostris extrusa TaxID=172846 RepID=A0AAV4XMM2_CAEEX|nr:hypothetical protein CEXT_671811 [Caerostris extrusa]
MNHQCFILHHLLLLLLHQYFLLYQLPLLLLHQYFLFTSCRSSASVFSSSPAADSFSASLFSSLPAADSFSASLFSSLPAAAASFASNSNSINVGPSPSGLINIRYNNVSQFQDDDCQIIKIVEIVDLSSDEE